MKKRTRGKQRARREAEFRARMRRLGRVRTWVGAFGFVPLAAALACGQSAGSFPFCAIPREWYLAVWAAIFGILVGLTIRMFRERRSHARLEVPDGPA